MDNLKILKFQKPIPSDRNIYEKDFPRAKEFVWAVMDIYRISLREIGHRANGISYMFNEKEFLEFVNLVETSDTYSKAFSKSRRKILLYCKRLDREKKLKKSDFTENDDAYYEYKIGGMV